MVKLHVILAISLDGFVASEGGGMDWIAMGDERADYMVEAIRNADTLMMGRKTYQAPIDRLVAAETRYMPRTARPPGGPRPEPPWPADRRR